jgi:hypothetical protein
MRRVFQAMTMFASKPMGLLRRLFKRTHRRLEAASAGVAHQEAPVMPAEDQIIDAAMAGAHR